MASPQSLFDKVWDAHVVQAESADFPGILYVDLHLLHEVTSPQGFTELRRRGIEVRRPDRHLATMDHSTPTTHPDASGHREFGSEDARKQVDILRQNCEAHGIRLLDFDNDARGIVHVIGPELGVTQPGMTICCGDSHTTTHGAFGALAFGIGSSQVGYVLATQCLLMRRPKSMRITVSGQLGEGVGAKDLALHIIKEIGVSGATGHVVEYAGSAIESLDMEQRMTLCNMTIEAGGRSGMIAVDATTIDYLKQSVPDVSEGQIDRWSQFVSDPGARFDEEVTIDGGRVRPMITWGTTPAMGIAVRQPIPEPKTPLERKAQEYMRSTPGQGFYDAPVSKVFIGSCTNGRLSDLQAAANVLRGRRVHDGVTMLVVPGSERVKRDAEAAGLDKVFVNAGAQWREPGCSMCIAMNGDRVAPGELAVSTSNRNFEGRQGSGARTVLAGPSVAAACAVLGRIGDLSELEAQHEVA